MTWRTRIEPFTRPIFFAVSRLQRGMTLGVRTVAMDARGPGHAGQTHLSGRLVAARRRGRSRRDLPGCRRRELREETGLIATVPPRLISVHSNERFFRGDHVLVFAVDAFTIGERTSHGEIAETGWFHPDALPEDAHRSTRDRLAEIFGGVPASTAW